MLITPCLFLLAGTRRLLSNSLYLKNRLYASHLSCSIIFHTLLSFTLYHLSHSMIFHALSCLTHIFLCSPTGRYEQPMLKLLLILRYLLQHLYRVIQGRIYKTKETRPRFINIIAQDSGDRRFALVDSVLDQLPHVCEVGVFDGKSINPFHIFFNRGRNIRVNRAVKALSSHSSWTGDILIMRGSARSQGVVNMRGHDRKLADFALKKYVFSASIFELVLIGFQGYSASRFGINIC